MTFMQAKIAHDGHGRPPGAMKITMDRETHGERMLSHTLNSLIDDGHVTVKVLSIVGECPESTVRDMLHRESDLPQYRRLARWCRHLPDVCRQALIDSLTAGTASCQTHRIDLDVNHDGRVDQDDAIDGAIQMNRHIAGILEQVRKASRDGRIDEGESAQIVQLLRDSIRSADTIVQLLMQITRKRTRISDHLRKAATHDGSNALGHARPSLSQSVSLTPHSIALSEWSMIADRCSANIDPK